MNLSKVITSAKFSFIRPFTLPNFVENFELLNQQFDFLANSNDYSQYYKDLESLKGKGGRFKEPCIIPNLGPLMPLRKKHTLNSYWQSIRLLLKIQEKKGEIDNELFFLLPLKISISNITSVRVKNIKFPVNVYIYLFSFGSCCINMEINVSPSLCNLLRTKGGFDELSDLITNLKGSTLDEKGSFEPFSLSIARELNQVLFGNRKDVIKFPTHTLIFVETSEPLIADFNQHKQAIASAMTRKTFKDVSTLTDEAMKKLIHCQIKKLRDGEIIFFSPISTFISPSPIWIGGLRQENAKTAIKNYNVCTIIIGTSLIRFLL